MTDLQLFDALPAHIEAALRDSIAELGVLVPVFVDQDGNVLDGHHRSRIASELEVEFETVTIEVDDEEHALRIAHTLNADRRQLSTADRLKAAARLRERGHSLRAIGEALGVSKDTVQRDVERAATVAPETVQPERVVGIDGKSRPAARPALADPQAGRDPSTRRPADEIIREQREARERDAVEAPAAPSPEVAEWVEKDPGVQDASYLHEFSNALVRAHDYRRFDAERLAHIASDDIVRSIEIHAEGAQSFLDAVKRARSGLRVVEGGRR